MRATERSGLAVMLAMALSLHGLTTITSDARLFFDCFLMIAVVGVSGMLSRRLVATQRGARLAQFGITIAALFALTTVEGAGNPFAVNQLLSSATRWAMESSAPMGPNLAVRVLCVVAVTALTLLGDQLAIPLNSPASVLLPMGVLYLVPALAVPALVNFFPLLWLGVGFVAVLLADSVNKAEELRLKSTDGRVGGLLLGGLASLVAALMVAGVAGVVTPGLQEGGGTPITGSGPVQMGDPTVDLRRNLQQVADRPVIRYSSTRPGGSYFRMVALPRFDATGFRLNPIDLYRGNLPAPEGAPGGLPRFTSQVRVLDFGSEWLPLPYAPAEFQAAGDWRFDPLSLSVLSAAQNQKQATNGLQYSVTSVDVSPSAAALSNAQPGRPTDTATTLALPADFPDEIVQLARRVTSTGTTPGQKAIMLQDWLRSNAFTYSTEPAPGSGYAALSDFLLRDRKGYCEQFAAGMAVMARALGIPSRVAVGFLPGRQVDGEWVINIRDMHAWPELYFANLGWVSFEPTPGIATAPSYTATQAPVAPSNSPSPTPTPSASTAAPSEEPTSTPTEEATPAEATPVDLTWLAWTGGALAVLALATVPTLIRQARRRRRLSAEAPREAVIGAWDEVRDTVWDAGGAWPRGSPRQIGDEVSKQLPEQAAEAMGRVAVLVEQSRYAPELASTDTLGDDLQQVRDGVSTERPRWWRRVLPPSLWRGLFWRG